jgi:hypothetical protein
VKYRFPAASTATALASSGGVSGVSDAPSRRYTTPSRPAAYVLPPAT